MSEPRPLVHGYPDFEGIGARHFAQNQPEQPETEKLLRNLRALLGTVASDRQIAVIGCGPKPAILRDLIGRGLAAIGVEPVPDMVTSAREYVGCLDRVLHGSAESLPFGNGSLDVIVMESVLEHVESISRTLTECFRTLRPGGVLYVVTTNRLRLSLTGHSGEFRVAFYNWLPRLVQEGYVFRHLHHDPTLANFSSRPAVHWFTYSDLCAHGRQAGFAQFYSLIDLLDASAPAVQRHWLRRRLLPLLQHQPWMRALALTQFGGSIFMFKRHDRQ